MKKLKYIYMATLIATAACSNEEEPNYPSSLTDALAQPQITLVAEGFDMKGTITNGKDIKAIVALEASDGTGNILRQPVAVEDGKFYVPKEYIDFGKLSYDVTYTAIPGEISRAIKPLDPTKLAVGGTLDGSKLEVRDGTRDKLEPVKMTDGSSIPGIILPFSTMKMTVKIPSPPETSAGPSGYLSGFPVAIGISPLNETGGLYYVWGDESTATDSDNKTCLYPHHFYQSPGTYTISIVTNQTNPSKLQAKYTPRVQPRENSFFEPSTLIYVIDPSTYEATNLDWHGIPGTEAYIEPTYNILVSMDTPMFNMGLTSAQSMFACQTNLLKVDANLFKWNKEIEDFSYAFARTSLLTIPSTLFAYTTKAESFRSTFLECACLQTIPASLFSKCAEAENFEFTFYGCRNMSKTENIFTSNKNIKSLKGTFAYCTRLTTVPEDLFTSASLNVRPSAEACFAGCTNLRQIPDWSPFCDSYGTCRELAFCYNCTRASNYRNADSEMRKAPDWPW